MESDIFVLLLGACEGAYALAASFRGEYAIPVVAITQDNAEYVRRVGEVKTSDSGKTYHTGIVTVVGVVIVLTKVRPMLEKANSTEAA